MSTIWGHYPKKKLFTKIVHPSGNDIVLMSPKDAGLFWAISDAANQTAIELFDGEKFDPYCALGPPLDLSDLRWMHQSAEAIFGLPV